MHCLLKRSKMSDTEEIDAPITDEGGDTEIDTVSDETEGTEADSVTESSIETGTEDISTTETSDGTSETASTSRPASPSIGEEETSMLHPRPQGTVPLKGKHIKAEDSERATCPIPKLSEVVIQNACHVEVCDLEKFLNCATTEQRNRILERLSLDLPLEVTLRILEDGTYWKRKCLKSWPAYDIWRYLDNWKSMFIHRTVQELVQNFDPYDDDKEFFESLKVFTEYVAFLEIHELKKVAEKDINIDLTSENFDEQLDDILSATQSRIYLDFEKVFEGFPRIKSLSIILSPRCFDLNNLHCNYSDFNCLFRGMHKLKELERFRISNGFLFNEQLTVIVQMFLTHTCLTELNLSYNFIDDSVCDYLGKLLISECPLESLVLKYNRFSDKGVKSIAAALVVNSKLRKLDISLNKLGDEGGQFLAEVLLINESIRDLDVSKNKLTSEAGIAFAKVVKEFDGSLRSLKLQENFLGEEAGKTLSDAVARNRNLLELDVHFCGFSNEDEELIHSAILRNRLEVPYSTCVNSDMTAAEFLF